MFTYHRSKELVDSNPDNVYFNVDVEGGVDPRTGGYSTFDYNKNFSTPFLTNPQEYFCTIAKASIPMACAPLVFIYIQEGLGQANPNLTTFSFCFRYSSTDYFEDVIYVPNNNLSVPPAPSANNGYQPISEYYYVYNYQTLLDVMNTAVSAAFTAMNSVHSGTLGPLGITEAPYFIYNNVTELFSLVYQSGYNGSSVELWMNDDLRTYFNNFKLFKNGTGVNNVNGKDYRFIFSDDKNNLYSVGYYANNQIIKATPRYINVVNKIVIVSNTLPVNSEWIPASPQTNTSGGSSNLGQAKILFDLDPILDFASDSTSKLIYNAENYRLIDMINTAPLKNLQLQVFFTDYKGNLFPICLSPYTSGSVKIYFVKKSLAKNIPEILFEQLVDNIRDLSMNIGSSLKMNN